MEPWIIKGKQGRPDRPAWIEDGNGCLIWQGHTYPNGYGGCTPSRGDAYAHRAVYKAFVGPIPDDMEVHHECRRRDCVHVGHMTLVTHREHGKHNPKAMQTHCIHGHEFTPENTIIRANGCRKCRTCRQQYDRVRYATQPHRRAYRIRTKEHAHA